MVSVKACYICCFENFLKRMTICFPEFTGIRKLGFFFRNFVEKLNLFNQRLDFSGSKLNL